MILANEFQTETLPQILAFHQESDYRPSFTSWISHQIAVAIVAKIWH